MYDLLLRPQAAGAIGNVHAWFADYLSYRKQQVFLPGAISDWASIRAGVPQGPILGPRLFLLYISDIMHDIGKNKCIRLFADDTSLLVSLDDPVTATGCINTDLVESQSDLQHDLLLSVVSKQKLCLSLVNRPLLSPVFTKHCQISEVESQKHLCLYRSHDCTWHQI